MTELRQAICPRCQFAVAAKAARCWRCGLNFVAPVESKPGSALGTEEFLSGPETAEVKANRATFSIASLMLITALVSVCLALLMAAPGLGILLMVLALPPVIRTALLVRARANRGLPVDTASKVAWFLGSLGVTLVVTIVTCCISFLAFCIGCALSIPFNKGGGDQHVWLVAIGSTVVVGGLMLWLFSFWIRARWVNQTTR